eukprot:1161134-Pelagomonas_calceolata.AAC.2
MGVRRVTGSTWLQNLAFKYLGMLVDKRMRGLKVSEEHAVQPDMAAQHNTKKFVHEHDLMNRPHALVLKADSHLADRDESVWSAHVSAAFSGMRNERLLGELRYRQQKVWREADTPSTCEMNRKAVIHHHWLWKTIESNGTHSLLHHFISIQGSR